jgi:hypothetical protein
MLVMLLCGLGTAPNVPAEDSRLSDDVIRSAVRRAIPLLEKGSSGSADQRTCFTCHNQALPIMALSEAKKHGLTIDEDNLARQLKHTHSHLERGRKDYLAGQGQGGRVLTAGYALWALEAGAHTPDETTAAVTSFLLQYQKDADHWRHPGNRPPSSGSDFTTTYVALRGLGAYGTAEQGPQINSRIDTVRQWLLRTEPKDTEDRVFRLQALTYAGAGEADVQNETKNLMNSRRDDGGWAQTPQMNSDAYATATALVALRQAGGLPADGQVIQYGLRFLIDTQLDDGSWHVVTRATPFQTYYESGFPHQQDQFISITASSWATLALLMSLPQSPEIPR